MEKLTINASAPIISGKVNASLPMAGRRVSQLAKFWSLKADEPRRPALIPPCTP